MSLFPPDSQVGRMFRDVEDLRVEAARRLGVPVDQISVTVDPRPGEPRITIRIYEPDASTRTQTGENA